MAESEAMRFASRLACRVWDLLSRVDDALVDHSLRRRESLRNRKAEGGERRRASAEEALRSACECARAWRRATVPEPLPEPVRAKTVRAAALWREITIQ